MNNTGARRQFGGEKLADERRCRRLTLCPRLGSIVPGICRAYRAFGTERAASGYDRGAKAMGEEADANWVDTRAHVERVSEGSQNVRHERLLLTIEARAARAEARALLDAFRDSLGGNPNE